jgi:L-asparaginase
MTNEKQKENKKKKILIIGYGGTIVMVVDSERNAIVPAKDVKEIIKLVPNLDKVADVHMEVLGNKDSTDVGPEDWTKLSMFIYNNHDKYDGFVITHGTNTLSYTASALSIALGRGLKKPVIITGSQLPLTVYGNDARFNFENAVKTAVTASEKNIAEVMIVFSDVILRGSRSVKTSESNFRAFDSPAFPEIGQISSTGIHFNRNARRVESNIKFDMNPRFSTNIISIDLTPGQHPKLIESMINSGSCNGVILKSHGAGSVPINGEFSFLPFIKKTVKDYKIPVIVSTKFLGGNSYKEINDDNAVQAIEAGAIPGGDLTDVMTEVKLMWLLANDSGSVEKIKEKMLKDYVGEVTEIEK